jgi:hypothetical protein
VPTILLAAGAGTLGRKQQLTDVLVTRENVSVLAAALKDVFSERDSGGGAASA